MNNFSVTIEGKAYNLRAFTGKVAERNESTVTNFRTHTSHQANRYGSSSSTSVSSTNTTYTDFYLVNDAGVEKAITLTDSNLKMRAGHEVTIIWLDENNKLTKVAAYNKNLHQTVWLGKVFKFHELSYQIMFLIGNYTILFAILSCLTIWFLPEMLSYAIALLLCMGNHYFMYKTYKFEKKAKPIFEQAIYDYLDRV